MTNRQKALLSLLPSALLPAASTLVYTAFYRRSAKNAFYHVFSAVFGMASFVSPLSGVLISVLYRMGKAPANDDITKLIEAGGLSPCLVILFALALVAVCLLLWRKGVLQNYWRLIRGDWDKAAEIA